MDELPEIQEEIDESVVHMGKVVPHIDQNLSQLLDSLKESLAEAETRKVSK
jgi:hypothetical protein